MDYRVKEICKKKKIPLGILAKRLGISRTALANQINGNPTIDSIKKISIVLECSVCELLVAEPGFTHVYHSGIYKGTIKI